MNGWLSQLSTRERWLVGAGACAVLAVAYFLTVVEPLAERGVRAERRYAAERALASYLDEVAAELATIPSHPAAATLPPGQTLIGAVNDSVERAGLAPRVRRLSPSGETQVDVTLDGAPWNEVLRWLVDVEQASGLRVVRLALNGREREPGVVDAVIGLHGAPAAATAGTPGA